MVINKLGITKPGGCEKSECVNDAAYEVIWNGGLGRKFLCTTHKRQLEQDPRVLAEWFQPK
jgi:hypothetical protein